MYPISHIMTLQPIYFSLIPSQYYLWTRVVLNSNVTFSEPEEWTCLQKTSSNLLCFNHWGLSLRISQLGTIQVLTAQLKPDFRPSKCLGRCGSAPKTIPEVHFVTCLIKKSGKSRCDIWIENERSKHSTFHYQIWNFF